MAGLYTTGLGNANTRYNGGSIPAEIAPPGSGAFTYQIREILLRFRHVRRSCLDSVRQRQEVVLLAKVLQQSMSGCLRLIHGVHYCHLLRCRLSLLFSWQSPCSIPAIMVFLHLQDVSFPEGVCYSLRCHRIPLSLIS